MGRLDGKAVLVTGGNGGLGSGIVKGMLKEGAKVAFCGRNEEKNQAALKTYREISEDVIAIRCDVSKSAEVKELFAKVVEAFGTVDILVNNAAVTGGRTIHHSNGKTDRENYLNLTT